MKKSRYTEEQIIGILKQHEAGVKTSDLCRGHGISDATFYNWKSKYGGMDVNEAQRLRQLEDENRRLKQWEEDGIWLNSWRNLFGELDGESLLQWDEAFLDGSESPGFSFETTALVLQFAPTDIQLSGICFQNRDSGYNLPKRKRSDSNRAGAPVPGLWGRSGLVKKGLAISRTAEKGVQ